METLTYKWLVPILLTVIGFFIVYYLRSMNEKIKDIDEKVTKHVDKVEGAMIQSLERHYKMASRVSVLENLVKKNGKEILPPAEDQDEIDK